MYYYTLASSLGWIFVLLFRVNYAVMRRVKFVKNGHLHHTDVLVFGARKTM